MSSQSSPFKTPWHFDKFKVDAEGDYSKIIGRFTTDFTDEIVLARSKDFQEQNYNEQRYEHAANTKSQNHTEEDGQLRTPRQRNFQSCRADE